MRIFVAPVLLASALYGAGTHAASNMPIEKVKTGILPSGGLYSIYDVTCHDQRSVNVASIAEQGQWCINYEGELNCFKRSQEASHQACSGDDKTVIIDHRPLSILQLHFSKQSYQQKKGNEMLLGDVFADGGL